MVSGPSVRIRLSWRAGAKGWIEGCATPVEHVARYGSRPRGGVHRITISRNRIDRGRLRPVWRARGASRRGVIRDAGIEPCATTELVNKVKITVIPYLITTLAHISAVPRVICHLVRYIWLRGRTQAIPAPSADRIPSLVPDGPHRSPNGRIISDVPIEIVAAPCLMTDGNRVAHIQIA